MAKPFNLHDQISPELLLRAYAAGIFPMAESRDDSSVFWVNPEHRGVLPLDGLHVPRKLKRKIRSQPFHIRCNTAFAEVIRACAEAAPGRSETWINQQIEKSYIELHRLGFAHSVECWKGQSLLGGLYGISLGGAFFGESMFSRVTDASKVALIHLVARLRLGGYVLLDTQFATDHLRQFRVQEIPAYIYRERLDRALGVDAEFCSKVNDDALESELEAVFSQSRTQTS